MRFNYADIAARREAGESWESIASVYGTTSNSVRSNFSRRAKQGADPLDDIISPPLVNKVDVGLHDYELVGDTFVFSINGKVWSIPRERMERICEDYSSYGGNLTQAELAREHGLPLEIVKRVLSAYKHYKASLPFTREKVKDYAERGELDALAEEAVEVQEHVLERKIQQKTVERAFARLRELEAEDYTRRQFYEQVGDLLTSIELPAVEKNFGPFGDNFVALVPTTDEHVGKYVWHKESITGQSLDTDLSCDYLKRHADMAAAWIHRRPGHCTRAVRMFGGDYFHALTGTTENGTHLSQDTRGARVWTMGVEAAIYSIQQLRGVADEVAVYGAAGNHDGFHFFQFMHALKLAFAGCPDVTVHADPRRFVAFREGTTLHVLDHGKGIGSLAAWKAQAQAEVVAREVGGELYHGAQNIYTWVGHLHEEQTATLGRHHHLIRLESLGESDDYETSLRYASDPVARVYALDGQGRLSDMHTIYAERLRGAA